MFGFVFRQTIVQTLIDFRVVSILSIIAGGWFVIELWTWYKLMMDTLLEQGKELPAGWDVAFFAFAGTALGAFWKAVSHIQELANKKHERDPD